VGRPPPKHLSKPLMVQILSHAYQLDTVGGYTKRLDRRLKSAALRDVVLFDILLNAQLHSGSRSGRSPECQ